MEKVKKPKKKVPKIVNGNYNCMSCTCSDFNESLTSNVCTCGHSFYDHRFYQNQSEEKNKIQL